MKCSVEDCERKAHARGWCKVHYERQRIRGTVEDFPFPTTEQRFFALVRKTSECWEWIGMKDADGYGRFRPVRNRKVAAHRWSWEHANNQEIQEGLTIDHLCRNRGCVNPEHLEPVTPRENTMRSPIAKAAVNSRKERCHRDHEPDWYVNSRGHRQCKECSRENLRRYRAKKRAERLK